MHARLRRRLLSYVLSWPQRADRYFATQPLRKWLWCGISVSAGFYAGACCAREGWLVHGLPACAAVVCGWRRAQQPPETP